MAISNDISGDLLRGKITETSPGKFEADDKIVKSVTAARAMFSRLRTGHLKRINLYKEIEGLIQGNPPYDPADLRAAGLQHIANFNDMSARALIKRACLAYWNLLHNSENLVRFVLRVGDPSATEYAKRMAQHWDYVIKTYWPSFNVNVASLSTQLVKFGVSPVLFPDERDPKWRVVELNRFYIPDQAQSDLDMLTVAFVETDFTVQYLWGVYQEFKDKKEKNSPWNVEQLGKLLVYMCGSTIKDQSGPIDVFDLERKLYSGDISFDNIYSDSVKIVSMFQREYDGKVSHMMFHRYHDTTVMGTPAHGEDFIFSEDGQYKNMAEALVLFTMNPGEFTIHANRGHGHEIYSLAQAKIMLDCSVVDMAKWASTPIIKSSSLNTKDVEQIRFYPGVPTNIGTAEFVQNNLGANIQGVVGAAQYMANLTQFNISYSGSDSGAPDPDQGSLSPSQTRLMAFREFSVLKNNIMHFYSTFDKVIANMTSKMLRSKAGYPGYEMAEKWKERCIEDGVPAEIFEIKESELDEWGMPSHIEVHATRAAGAGSQVAHLIGLQELQAISGSFGPREERAFKRQFIMATVGPEYVDTFMQEADAVDEQAGGASLAGVENAIMQAGKSPIFSPDNEHRSHTATHLALLQSMIEQLQQQQMDPVEADSVFNVAVPHTGEHINALANNVFAQAFFQQVAGQFSEISRYAALNRKNAAKILQSRIKEQQAQQQAEQAAMTDEEIKTMQAVNEERRSDMKLDAQSQRQERAGVAKEQALERKTESDIALKRRKVQGELAIKGSKTAGDHQIRKQDSFLKNTSEAEAEANPSGALKDINGVTPSPYDLEGGGNPNL